MPYYIRVLSTSADSFSLSELQSAIERDNLRALLSAEEDADEDWTQLILRHTEVERSL